VQLDVGTLQAMMGDTTAAVRAMAAVVERFPRHPGARYNLGLLYWRTGQTAEARRTWEPLLAESPNSDLSVAVRDLVGRTR
jgi:cytochrome c-type biogenesis protein CcmH/NrfG